MGQFWLDETNSSLMQELDPFFSYLSGFDKMLKQHVRGEHKHEKRKFSYYLDFFEENIISLIWAVYIPCNE